MSYRMKKGEDIIMGINLVKKYIVGQEVSFKDDKETTVFKVYQNDRSIDGEHVYGLERVDEAYKIETIFHHELAPIDSLL